MYIFSESGKKPDYIPGLERWSNYKTIWIRDWIDFVKIYPCRFENIYGKLNDDKKEEVRKLIRCGRFQNGFKRHTCPNCGGEEKMFNHEKHEKHEKNIFPFRGVRAFRG